MFPIGSSYYAPFHTPTEWIRDFARMAEAGLGVVRTAELIASWEWIEPRRGELDFEWLDQTFDLAQAHSMKVLLGTGAASPPIWLRDSYPDVQIVSQDGITYPTGTMWGWACIDHPGYREEAERYLRLLLARYSRHPALLGWQIHNEIGYPAIARRPNELYCYCAHTTERFRAWLYAKYEGRVEALNTAWAWGPTHHRYTEWTQINPPRSTPSEWGSVGAWMDWREFLYQHFADFVAWQQEIIKSVDAEHPTTTNLVHLMDQEVGVVRGIDPWRYPATVDAVGYDLYPMDRFKAEPFFTSLSLDYARSPALHAGKPFWLPEMESGPIGDWVLGPRHATTERDIRRYTFEAIGHGAKMVLYQGYREWDALPLHWGALVDLHGEPTERYEAVALITTMMREQAALFAEAQPVRAKIALLWDQRNATAIYGMGAHEFLLRAVKGLYAAHWSAGYPVEFVTPELLAAGAGADYNLIFMPFMMLVTPTAAAALTNFVDQGGTLVAFAKCGMLDQRGWYWHDRPGGGLDRLFGARERGIQQMSEVNLLPSEEAELFTGIAAPLKGYWHRQDFVLGDGVQVVATYEDGAPAVLRRRQGQGQAILCGTHLDIAALDGDSNHQRLMINLARAADVQRPFVVEGGAELDGHLLKYGDQRLFILINHSGLDRQATIHVRDAPKNAIVLNLLTGQEVVAVIDQLGRLVWHVKARGYDALAYLIR